MNILFDLTGTQSSHDVKFHGGGYYGETVFFALIKKTKNIIGIYDSNLYINPKIIECGIKIFDINKISPKEIIEKGNINTFYTPLFNNINSKMFKFNIDNYLITWHGARELEMPYNSIEYYYASNLKERIKKIIKILIRKRLINIYKKKYSDKQAYINNSQYITDSEHSKSNLISFYPHLADKNIEVLYPPFMEEKESDILPKGIKPKTYFLLTSSARWEKNNLRAVWAFDELFSQNKSIDYLVILTGVTKEKIFTKKIKNNNKFIFFNYIEKEELNTLHKNAYAFIYPSLNEGFGYPPVISMKYGIPVAASGISSIPEICQNAAIYFDPYNVNEIKSRIIQLLNKDIYNEYSKRSVIRYNEISEKQKLDLEKIINFILKEN